MDVRITPEMTLRALADAKALLRGEWLDMGEVMPSMTQELRLYGFPPACFATMSTYKGKQSMWTLAKHPGLEQIAEGIAPTPEAARAACDSAFLRFQKSVGEVVI